MQSVLSAGRYETGAKPLYSLPSTEKIAAGATTREKLDRCQTRENLHSVPSTVKNAAGATTRGKKFSLCQVRENMQPVPAAEIYAIGALRRGKICSRCQAQENACKPRQNGFGLSIDWLKENLVCFTLAL